MTSPPHSFQRLANTDLPFETLLANLKTAIADADLWLLHEINPQALLQRGGFEIAPARQLLFFHPRYMARLLTADPTAALEAPLKCVVLQQDQGVLVCWYDLQSAFERYDNPQLKALGGELFDLCETIIAAALGKAS